jgi:ribosome-associated protein
VLESNQLLWCYVCSTYFTYEEETLDSITLARQIVDIVEDRQASDILLLDVHELTSIAAFFIIATIDNERQAKAIEDNLLEKLKLQQNIRPLHAEGLGGQGGGWSILDYGDVIVHLFTEEMRRYYKLEEVWSKAQVLVRML